MADQLELQGLLRDNQSCLKEMAKITFAWDRHHAAQPHRLPILSVPSQALTATRHLLEMYRRQLGDEKTRRTIQRLDRRLLTVASQLDRLATAQKMRKD